MDGGLNDELQVASDGERCEIAGMPFDVVTRASALEAISHRSELAPFAYVVTPNVDHIVRCQKQKLRALYDAAWLSLCDSRVIARSSRLLGIKVPGVITGSDLTLALFDDIIQPGDSITIIGCDYEHIQILRRKMPEVTIHHYNPPMGFAGDEIEIERAADFVVNHRSRFTFLAVGSPQQEKLACLIKQKPATGIGFCIGASILFLTGGEKRAPNWVQRVGLEWLFRLMQNPGRLWRRYLVDDPVIFRLIFQQKLRELRKWE
jgi:N-acetylglucosaminyldiphosphoundecaprenol N-acetyl-beta-D-mannosaminyltransferase